MRKPKLWVSPLLATLELVNGRNRLPLDSFLPYTKAQLFLYCFLDTVSFEASHLKCPSLHKVRLIHNDLTHFQKVAGILKADTTSENVLKTLKALSLYMVLFPLLYVAVAV